MDWLKLVHRNPATPPFDTGDDVRVWYTIREQGKERLGQFEGVVIRVRGSGPNRSFTVRRVTHGEGVERAFPADAKIISRIEVLRRGKTKRSRLYYLRNVVKRTRLETAEEPGKASASGASSPDAGTADRAERATPERSEVVAAGKPVSSEAAKS